MILEDSPPWLIHAYLNDPLVNRVVMDLTCNGASDEVIIAEVACWLYVHKIELHTELLRATMTKPKPAP